MTQLVTCVRYREIHKMKNLRRFIFLSLIFAVISCGACRKQPAPSQPNTNNATTAPQETAAGGAAQAGDKFYFHGTIANDLRIEMAIVRDGQQLAGTYFYPKVGKDIGIKGTIDKEGNVDLREADDGGKETGIFKGKWKQSTEAPDSSLFEIEGKWSKPDGTKETGFHLYQQPIGFSGAVRLVPKLIKETNKQAHYTIDVEYPQIEGDARFDKFNKEVRAMVTKKVTEWKTGETSTDAEVATELTNQDSTLETGYDFRLATDDLISVEFSEGVYERGAAHGNSITTVLNYDVKNGKKLSLVDLFNPKATYLNLISAYCIKDLKQQAAKDKEGMLSDDMIQSGASARASNYDAWAITRKGLWITFDPYEVAAYAAGPQHVLVPYSALKDIIKPDGPIAGLAK